jgi:hypothetical protein
MGAPDAHAVLRRGRSNQPGGPSTRYTALDSMTFVTINDRTIGVSASGSTPAVGVFARVLCEHLPLSLNLRLIDLGCGSGVVGLYVLLCGAQNVLFNDIQQEALSCAERNLKLNGISRRFGFHKGSFEELESSDVSDFDLIAFNPPQYPMELAGSNPFPDSEQLFRNGGNDGLEVFRLFLNWYSNLSNEPPRAILSLSSLLNRCRIEEEIRSRGLSFEERGRDTVPIRESLVDKVSCLPALQLQELLVTSTPSGRLAKQLLVFELSRLNDRNHEKETPKDGVKGIGDTEKRRRTKRMQRDATGVSIDRGGAKLIASPRANSWLKGRP